MLSRHVLAATAGPLFGRSRSGARDLQVLRIVYLCCRRGTVRSSLSNLVVLAVDAARRCTTRRSQVNGGHVTRAFRLTRLIAVVDDERGLVHIEVRRCGRVVEVAVSAVRCSGAIAAVLQVLVRLAHHLGRVLQRLLNLLLLILLVDEGLYLLRLLLR